MQHLKFFKEINKESVAIAGGKGASLGEMTKAGINVPPGFVVLSNAFDRFIEETGLTLEIESQIGKVNPEDTNSIDKASHCLRDTIRDTQMPEDLEKEIMDAFLELGAEFVAVRSSATAEDSAVASWAGELDTFLNTTKENLLDRVKECWSSLFTPRAIFYRYEKNLAESYVSVAVVIQKMVQSEISGIAFTVHPVTEDRDQMILEAGYGLGEAIVSGQVTPDSYVISKSDMSILDIHVGHQTKYLQRKKSQPSDLENLGNEEDGSNEWVELSEEEGSKQKLTGRQIIALAEQCKIIEEHYGFPCDIEWAMEGGNIYVTQSRPITTLKN